jgi:hypothetical protein
MPEPSFGDRVEIFVAEPEMRIGIQGATVKVKKRGAPFGLACAFHMPLDLQLVKYHPYLLAQSSESVRTCVFSQFHPIVTVVSCRYPSSLKRLPYTPTPS